VCGGDLSSGTSADLAVAGVLPVRIDLPVEGIAHYFKRTLVPQGKPLELSLYTYNSELRPVTRFVLLALGLLIGLTFGRLLLLRLVEGRIAPRLLVLMVVSVALLLALRSIFHPTFGPAYFGIVIGAGVTLLPWVITQVAQRARTPNVRAELQQEGA